MTDYSAYHWAKKAKELVESIGHALVYKGSVATYADLPSSDQKIGDMWNVLSDGSNYAWDGTNWDNLSGVVDLSAYRTSADQDIIDARKFLLSITFSDNLAINSFCLSVNCPSVGFPVLLSSQQLSSTIGFIGDFILKSLRSISFSPFIVMLVYTGI